MHFLPFTFDSATIWAIFSPFHFLLFKEHISWEPFQNPFSSLGTKGLNLRQCSVSLLQQLRKTWQWPKKSGSVVSFLLQEPAAVWCWERCPVLFSHPFILYLLVKILSSSILLSFLITTDNEIFHQKMRRKKLSLPSGENGDGPAMVWHCSTAAQSRNEKQRSV